MNIGANTPAPAEVSYATASQDFGGVYSPASGTQSPPDILSEFTLDERVFYFDGGEKRLRLEKALTIRVNAADMSISVLDWDVVTTVGQAPFIGKTLVKEYLLLWQKAQRGLLKPIEEERWGRIVDYVDVIDFEAQYSLPRYVEGVLLERGKRLKVELHGGTRIELPPQFTTRFDLIAINEGFSARITFSRGQIEMISNVMPISQSEDAS